MTTIATRTVHLSVETPTLGNVIHGTTGPFYASSNSINVTIPSWVEVGDGLFVVFTGSSYPDNGFYPEEDGGFTALSHGIAWGGDGTEPPDYYSTYFHANLYVGLKIATESDIGATYTATFTDASGFDNGIIAFMVVISKQYPSSGIDLDGVNSSEIDYPNHGDRTGFQTTLSSQVTYANKCMFFVYSGMSPTVITADVAGDVQLCAADNGRAMLSVVARLRNQTSTADYVFNISGMPVENPLASYSPNMLQSFH